MRWGIQRKFADNDTGSMDDMVDAVLVGLPLRAFVLMSPAMSFRRPRPDHRDPQRRPARGPATRAIPGGSGPATGEDEPMPTTDTDDPFWGDERPAVDGVTALGGRPGRTIQ